MNIDKTLNLSNYEKLVELASASYKFTTDQNSLINLNEYSIWRHDVDMDPQAALKLASIEQKYGVRSVYLFMLNSRFYSLFEKETYEIVKEIAKAGHHIGIHLDLEFYEPITSDDGLNQIVQFQIKIFEQLFSESPGFISFHNPTLTKVDMKSHLHIGGLLNLYAKQVQEKYAYCSDSNGMWRYSFLGDFLRDNLGKNIQVLSHPEWWRANNLEAIEKVKEILSQRAERCLEGHLSRMNEDGRAITS